MSEISDCVVKAFSISHPQGKSLKDVITSVFLQKCYKNTLPIETKSETICHNITNISSNDSMTVNESDEDFVFRDAMITREDEPFIYMTDSQQIEDVEKQPKLLRKANLIVHRHFIEQNAQKWEKYACPMKLVQLAKSKDGILSKYSEDRQKGIVLVFPELLAFANDSIQMQCIEYDCRMLQHASKEVQENVLRTNEALLPFASQEIRSEYRK